MKHMNLRIESYFYHQYMYLLVEPINNRTFYRNYSSKSTINNMINKNNFLTLLSKT